MLGVLNGRERFIEITPVAQIPHFHCFSRKRERDGAKERSQKEENERIYQILPEQEVLIPHLYA